MTKLSFSLVYIFITIVTSNSVSFAKTTVDDVIQALKSRDSVIDSFKYEMTQIKRRTKDGTKLLAEQHPGKVEKLDDPEAPARRDFVRIRSGEKDFLKDIHYSDDLSSITGQIFHAWNGSIGKRYVPETKSGRVEKQPFAISEEFPERAGLEFLGKPLYEWLEMHREKTRILPHPDGVLLEVEITKDYSVVFNLDPTRNFMPKEYKVLIGGSTGYEMQIEEYEDFDVDGVQVYFPVKYKSTIYTPRDNRRIQGKKPEMIALVKTVVDISKVELNPNVSDSQFEIDFPPGTKVYDEFLGQSLPTEKIERILLEELDNSADQYRTRLSQEPKPPRKLSNADSQTSDIVDQSVVNDNIENKEGRRANPYIIGVFCLIIFLFSLVVYIYVIHSKNRRVYD